MIYLRHLLNTLAVAGGNQSPAHQPVWPELCVTTSKGNIAVYSLVQQQAQAPALLSTGSGAASRPVFACAYTRDGRVLATASGDGALRLWPGAGAALSSSDGAQCVRALREAHAGGARCCAVSNDCHTLISGGFDRSVALWDMETGTPVTRLRGHTGWLFSVTVSAVAPALVVSGAGNPDYGVRVWDVRSGETVQRLTGNADHAPACALSDTGVLVTGGESNCVRVWRYSSGPATAVDVPVQHESSAVASGVVDDQCGADTLRDAGGCVSGKHAAAGVDVSDARRQRRNSPSNDS